MAQVARQLGPKTTISNLFDKTDSIYSMVEVRESVLAQFYSEHQQADVTVSDCSHQLEDLLTAAVELGRVNPLRQTRCLAGACSEPGCRRSSRMSLVTSLTASASLMSCEWPSTRLRQIYNTKSFTKVSK